MKFEGAALYTIDEIGSALKVYRRHITNAEKIITKSVSERERTFNKKWYHSILRIDSFKDLYSRKDTYDTYRQWLNYKYVLPFSDTERGFLENLSHYSSYGVWFDIWKWDKEYNQIKNLYNGGKECYLNPTQAKFVNTFKESDCE